jgi:hypothetical protein
MKKIKYLASFSLSLILLTSCFSSNVYGDIEFMISSANVVTNENEKNQMVEKILDSKVGARANNQHVLSVNARFYSLIFRTSLVGYGYYNYNQDTDKSNFNLDVSGLSNLKIVIDENQVMDANLNIANIELLKYDEVQLNFDAKPLNELADFSLLSVLDKTYIKEYRKSSYEEINNFELGFLAYVFTLDANKLNELLNSSIKFETDPVLTFLSSSSGFETIDIIHLTGDIAFNSISGSFEAFIYNVNSNN